MEIVISGTDVNITGDRIIGFQLNNLVNRFEATTDLTNDWSYQLYVHMIVPDLYNIINMEWQEGTQNIYVDLTADMLPYSGRYEMQFVATNGEISGRTDIFEVWVQNSIDPSKVYDPVPSEFYQIQDNITQIYEEIKKFYEQIDPGELLDVDVINGGDADGTAGEGSGVGNITGGNASGTILA